MRVAFVASGGGVPGIAWHAGVLFGLQGRVEYASMDGVSAGAIAVAIAGQNPATKVPYLRELGEAIRTNDGHRWKTGKEIALKLLGGFLGGSKLDCLGDSSRMASRIQREVGGAFYDVATFVGTTDIDTGEYFSVAARSTSPRLWPKFVLASASIGPPLWPPVILDTFGRRRRLVDGGYRNVAPLMDVLDRVNAGLQEYPELIVVSSTRPLVTGPVPAEPANEIRHDSIASLGLLTDTIHLDDIEGPLRINRLIRQVDEINRRLREIRPLAEDFLLTSESGVPYQYIPIVTIRPDRDMAKSALDDTHQREIAAAGEAAARAAALT